MVDLRQSYERAMAELDNQSHSHQSEQQQES